MKDERDERRRRLGLHSASGFCQACWDRAALMSESNHKPQADNYNELILGECSESQTTS